MEEQYNWILNMTNKEAAAIIKNTLMTQAVGRANGKTMMVAALNHALIKAIIALENMPDGKEKTE